MENVENHLTASANMKKKDIMIGNFLGGLAWGVGSVIGASVIVGILFYILKGLGVFNFFSAISGQSVPNL
ncbi:hypothetical protein A2617_00975 [Candidatus Daviesbacteria bacterium RIFOXYD1_FULL_41_10]|uniref:Uncharacterized protein n=2 Tax=Candidatus Daviesiibacteriota TaxID=1752718 RepID=A0A1F5N2F0_9BACT|nr:MAG: hypothetical protein UU67_C0004G0009 [Candidatus Daviesbacteria bacterium GW2011_GWB1_41_5]OGE71817.1 MAG: hypothetical protein A2617_00975 [Candidatus Daviesbacteria bacterium RIFOXYD1_FULL_41_10]